MKKGEKSRIDILTSTKALIAKRGFIAVTLDEILEAAQVTKGKFFHYFESKEDYFRELLRFALTERAFFTFESLLSQAAFSDSFSKLLYVLDNVIEWHKGGLPEEMRLCLFATLFFPQKSEELQHISCLLSKNVRTLETLIKECIDGGLLPKSIDPSVACLLFSSAAMGGNSIGFLLDEKNLSVRNVQELKKLFIELNHATKVLKEAALC